MKKVNLIPLLVMFFAGCGTVLAGTIDPPYEVGTWQGFRTAAITYSFDDNCYNQYLIAIPMFNQYDYDGTFFLVTDWVTDWTPWQNGAAEGHEMASHTVTHARLKGLNEADQIYEYSVSQDTINTYIPGNQCRTIAYPNCRSGTESLCAQYYIAGRNCSGGYNLPTPDNFYEIKANICGSRGSVKSIADFISKNEAAAAAGGWQMYLLHGIDDDGGYSPLTSTILQESLDYLDARRSTYWVSNMLNVVKYIKERDDVSVTEVSNQGNSITVQVTDTLDNAVYNYPITIRRPLPTGWSAATVKQGGQPVDSSIVAVSGTTYVMFDAVPDGGDVVISEGQGDTTPPAAPSNLTAAAVSASQIDLDWDDNSEGDLASYNVYRDGYQIETGVSSSQYSDTGLSPSTQYCYTVTAVDTSSNESAQSNQACDTTQEGDTTPPAAPTNLGATAVSASQIDLDWDDNTEGDLASYNVYRDGSPVATGVASSQYSDTGLSPSTQYCYTVTAVDTSNNESAESNQACATTQDGSVGTMHVDSILVTIEPQNPVANQAVTTVVIKDNLGAPVSGATVVGTYSGGVTGSDSDTTDATGTATLFSGVKKGLTSATFCVDSVTHATLTYDSGANVETCDSGSL